ncbi:hypothetical protein MPLB_1510008 [Mesorhizobium sp. ORS 3324]|nr:hypothetical protein MPLB_1510008 [Mesorhizobium sp. ORS 3324]
MQLTTNASTKRTNQTEAGELISIRLGGDPYIGIVLANENNRVVLGIVSGFKADLYAFHLQLNGGGKCISFGKDWLLEPDFGPQTWVGNQEFSETPGVVHITPDSAMITFAPRREDWQHSALSFDLRKGEIDQYDYNTAAPVLAWSIWENAASRDRKGAKPLASFLLKA